MIEIVRENWGWVGIEPIEIIGSNEFGNFIIKDINGAFWRLCPEDVYCEIIAKSDEEYNSLLHNQEFIEDWEMKNLVDYAKQLYGSLPADKSYCLKIPGILGGEYGGENIGTISTKELISFSGYIGQQIQNLPDGSQVEFRFTE